MQDLVGKVIASRFSVDRVLGHGAMGHVFRATDLVTEYLTGRCLQEHMGSATLAARTWVLDIGVQILSALTDAHHQGVIHRDIKPANIFVLATDTIPLHIKVLDFGLSRTVENAVDAGFQTQLGVPVGTPRYMAPEILSGQPASTASDIYSLGLILYELSTGVYPYSFRDVRECLHAHLTAEAPPFPPARISFPSEYEELVMAMLDKDPSNRPDCRACHRVIARTNTAMILEKWTLMQGQSGGLV